MSPAAEARRMLLDTSSLMYRAFFSVPQSIVDRDGQPSNAVHGYLDWMGRLAVTRRPAEMIHVYDADWRPAPRVAIYDGYKSTRLPDPPALPPQFDVLRDVLDAFGADQVEAEGWEADDAIGVISATAGDDERIDIVTGDRDLIQLVRDPVVRVLFTVKGVTDLRQYDEAGVVEKYGLPPSRYAEFAMLRGDPSDGLPGVKGVGEKTARLLVEAYPSIWAMVADAMAATSAGALLRNGPRLKAALRDAGPYLEKMRDIVPVRTDVALTSWRKPRDDERLDELAAHYDLKGPVQRLRAALDRGRILPEP